MLKVSVALKTEFGLDGVLLAFGFVIDFPDGSSVIIYGSDEFPKHKKVNVTSFAVCLSKVVNRFLPKGNPVVVYIADGTDRKIVERLCSYIECPVEHIFDVDDCQYEHERIFDFIHARYISDVVWALFNVVVRNRAVGNRATFSGRVCNKTFGRLESVV